MGECLEGRRVFTKCMIITGRFFAAAVAASAIVVRTTIKVRGRMEGRKWSGRSAKNDTKYGHDLEHPGLT